MRRRWLGVLVVGLAACDDAGTGAGAADAAAAADGAAVHDGAAGGGGGAPGEDAAIDRDAATPADGGTADDAATPADATTAGDGAADAACDGADCGTLLCAPGQPACAGERTLGTCNEDGTAVLPGEDCPSGAACRGGVCRSECLLAGKTPSYIGCEYWSVDLDNYPDPFGDPAAVPHAVVIGNPSASTAHVQIGTQANVRLPANMLEVPAGEVRAFTFPRLDVDGTGITNHSFRLQSDWPVVAYQFNPLNNVGVASNDASLLLPAESLGTEYIVMSWPTSPVPDVFMVPPQHGYFTVVATRPGRTEVTVVPTANVQAGPTLPAMPAGTPQTFTLQQGDVLNLEADGSNLFELQDLTGTTVTASQPVAVFGGHEEAVIGGCCADHLEEQLFPVNTWGTRYLAVPVEPRGGSRDLWRVLASEDATEIRTLPPQADADAFVLNRGEFRDLESAEAFEVVATKPILVSQYLYSQEATEDGIGDPSQILAVPVVQYRDFYPILVPADYLEDWLTVIRPAGVEVRLDGVPIAEGLFHGFGLGTHEFAYVTVHDGPHAVDADEPFGLVAYGYSAAVSYGYPAGLDLRPAER